MTSSPPEDLTGRRSGRLLVLGRTTNDRHNNPRWKCSCECGAIVSVLGSALRGGRTQSCGCLRREVAAASLQTHGLTGILEHRIWKAMRNRCHNPAAINWAYYGGRGVTVCERWDSFENFLADMGPIPGPGYSIDRKDADGHYTPENCRWISRSENARTSAGRRGRGLAPLAAGAVLLAWLLTITAPPAAALCVGDCNDDNRVTVDEIIIGIDMDLNGADPERCPALQCTTSPLQYDDVFIPCIVEAVNNLLDDCPERKSAP